MTGGEGSVLVMVGWSKMNRSREGMGDGEEGDREGPNWDWVGIEDGVILASNDWKGDRRGSGEILLFESVPRDG